MAIGTWLTWVSEAAEATGWDWHMIVHANDRGREVTISLTLRTPRNRFAVDAPPQRALGWDWVGVTLANALDGRALVEADVQRLSRRLSDPHPPATAEP